MSLSEKHRWNYKSRFVGLLSVGIWGMFGILGAVFVRFPAMGGTATPFTLLSTQSYKGVCRGSSNFMSRHIRHCLTATPFTDSIFCYNSSFLLWNAKILFFFSISMPYPAIRLPPLGRHVLKGINCATESMGIGLSWFVFHFS